MGRWERFGLARRHKLTAKRPMSCGAARLESADYQLFVDWRRLAQLRRISERSFAVIIIYRNNSYLHFCIFNYLISHISKRYYIYRHSNAPAVPTEEYIHVASPLMYYSDFAPNSVPLGVQWELPKRPQKLAEVARWEPLEQTQCQRYPMWSARSLPESIVPSPGVPPR